MLGLAACISLSSARRAARVSAGGHYVPLDAQNCALWDAAQIAWGERLLHQARSRGPIGRFQLEAAIQSVHIDRARTGITDWDALALLYEGLMRMAPAVGTAVGRAIAVGHSQGPEQGLAALDQIEPHVRESFQPAWAARAQLLTMAGRHPQAIDALNQAIARSGGRRVIADLERRRNALEAQRTACPLRV